MKTPEEIKEYNRLRMKVYRDKNKYKINQQRRVNRKLLPIDKLNTIKEQQKEYYQLNKEYIIKQATINSRIYRKNNINHHKKIHCERVKLRYKTEPIFNITHSIRNLIRVSFKNNGYTKNSKTTNILGCDFEFFKNYIESQFKPWMNWNNKGLYNGTFNYGWDIDHIKPIASAKTIEDIIKLNHYTNLQPLCSHINRNIKKDKLI